MRVGFLITGRLKSNRLKRKLLLPLNGYSVIERVIQRAKAVVACDEIVLCTSKTHQDLTLVRIARKHDIYYYTGHSIDVLRRLRDACLLFNFDFFIGITADNPLFSIYHANLLADMVRQDPTMDFVYTTGMPIGVNIYAMNVKALKTVCAVKEQIDTEIWGYLVNRPEIFNVKEVPATQDFVRGDYRMTLDEMDDYYFFKALYQNFDKDEVIDLLAAYYYLDSHHEVAMLNENVVQRDLDEETKKSIDAYYSGNKEKVLRIKKAIYDGLAQSLH